MGRVVLRNDPVLATIGELTCRDCDLVKEPVTDLALAVASPQRLR
jgi:hypothetical protein